MCLTVSVKNIVQKTRESSPSLLMSILVAVYAYLLLIRDIDTSALTLSDTLGFLYLGTKPLDYSKPFSLMRIPIHWLAIYVSLFFSVAWASRCRPKTVEFAMMVSSKNRANYWLMMYFVTMIQVVLNFALIGLTLMICVLLCGGNMTMLPSTQFVERYVSLSEPALRLENIAIAYIALPFAASCSLAAIQVALSQFIGITKSYCIIVTILVISSFIDLWALPGSCLMMIRNIYIMSDLRLAATGFAVVAITMIAAYILGYVRIKKCDLSHHKLV